MKKYLLKSSQISHHDAYLANELTHTLIELEPGEIILSVTECQILWNLLKDHWIARDESYETTQAILHKLSSVDD